MRGPGERGRGGRGVLLLAAAAVLLPALGARAALGPHQDDGATDPCAVCHESASGDPALKGWTGGAPSGPATGWGAKPLSALCFSCHDGNGGSLATDAHDMENSAYAVGAHGYTAANLPRYPDGGPDGALAASRLPYSSTAELECTSCHDVHNDQFRPFSHRASYQLLCAACHGGRVNNAPALGTGNSFGGTPVSFSTHPTAVGFGSTPGRATIKALTDVDAALKVAVADAPGYSLGGHLSAGDLLDCQTCHAVHGDAAGFTGVDDLLAIDNVTVPGNPDPSALCEACHRGGDAGLQVGTALADGSTIIYSDHPIDSAGNSALYPTGVAIPDGVHVPVSWKQGSTPNGDRGAQPFYGAAGSATPVCSSCHDAHGGLGGTALLRGPSYDGSSAVYTFDYAEWCFVCHLAAEVIPPGHHSTVNSWPASQLTCGDCHGQAGVGGWQAHNGFWSFPVVVSDTDSAFCVGCHNPDDPTDLLSPALKGRTFAEPAAFPSSHGTPRGSGSHYLGPDSDEFAGVEPKTTVWSSGYFSSYGAPNTGGGGDVAPVGAGSLICESCHHILYNDGRANPGSYTSALQAGYESNLLLEPYEDDPPGAGTGSGPNAVGSALCEGCHQRSGTHHPMTGDVVPLSGLPLRTGAGSFADQTAAPIGGGAAPGTLSYPDADAVDCDSCHRPHGADGDSTVAGPQHGPATSTDGRPTRHILEVDGAGHVWTSLCDECHAR